MIGPVCGVRFKNICNPCPLLRVGGNFPYNYNNKHLRDLKLYGVTLIRVPVKIF